MKTESKVKTVSVSGFEANRLTFRTKNYSPSKPGGEHEHYIWDARGYNFVNYPITGNTLDDKDHPDHAPKSKTEYSRKISILFDAYDNGDEAYFAFFTSDCFDPPLYLIVAANWEEAYDIFLDEFADDEGCEEEIESAACAIWYEKSARDDLPYEARKTAFAALDQDTRDHYIGLADEELMNNGQICIAPNGARTVGGSPYRWCESINGFELELIKAEKL